MRELVVLVLYRFTPASQYYGSNCTCQAMLVNSDDMLDTFLVLDAFRYGCSSRTAAHGLFVNDVNADPRKSQS